MFPKLRFLWPVIFLSTLGSEASAQQHECAWLMQYGIYDFEDKTNDRNTVENLRFLLAHSSAGTVEEFQKEAGAAGLNVFGLFELSLGGQTARQNFRAWRDSFINTSSHDLLTNDLHHDVIRRISPVLMEAVKVCLKHPQPGLVGWVVPTKDDVTFTLNLKYVRHDTEIENEGAKITSVTFVTSPPGSLIPLGDAQENQIRKGAQVPLGGIGIVFQRTKPTVGVTIVVNTDKGTTSVRIPPEDVVDPIQELQKKIAQLEKKIDLIGHIETGKLALTHHAAGRPADGVVFANAKKNAEKRFHFKLTFNNPPLIMTSIEHYETGGRDFQGRPIAAYRILVRDTTNEGFTLISIPTDDTERYELEIRWIAIPFPLIAEGGPASFHD